MPFVPWAISDINKKTLLYKMQGLHVDNEISWRKEGTRLQPHQQGIFKAAYLGAALVAAFGASAAKSPITFLASSKFFVTRLWKIW